MTMTEQEYKELQDIRFKGNSISYHELPEGYEGTLVYGYTCERNTFHCYAKDGEIHIHIYDYNDYTVYYTVGESVSISSTTPDKRVYRQDSQFFFLKLLVEKGHDTFSLTESNSEESLGYGKFLKRALL
jgi:hypothetical protein